MELAPSFCQKDFVNRNNSFRLWIDLFCSIFIVNFILFHAAIVRSHVKQNGEQFHFDENIQRVAQV